MKVSSRAAAATIAIALLLAQAVAARAVEINVLSGAGMRLLLEELGPQFERATGHKLATKFVPGPVVEREIEAGAAFDVAISQAAPIDKLVKAGKIDAATRADFARVGVGMAVRAGAPKPDIGSVEAFKRALLNAKSVAYAREGASGVYFTALLDRLGIAAEVKPKLISPPVSEGGPFVVVARGEAEIGIAVINFVPGADFVGPLPAELQTYLQFVVGVGTSAKETEAAKALVKFLTSDAAAAVIKAKGMEPRR
jgi:molybdate transport system substrate-binding protein